MLELKIEGTVVFSPLASSSKEIEEAVRKALAQVCNAQVDVKFTETKHERKGDINY